MKKYGLPKIKNHLSAPKMKRPLDLYWDKEFEDKIIYDNAVTIVGDGDEIFREWYGLENEDISELIEKYFKDNQKVKVKCKNGCIQIERI